MNVTLPMLGQRLRALSVRRAGLAAWLWGEAGIGKTYTSRALLRGTPCRSVTLAAALPLPEVLRALPRPARLRAWTRAALDSLQSGQTVTVPTPDILAALLGQLAPFVLHLEDLHDTDDARKTLVWQLAAAVARTRGAALLVSSRLAPPEDWPEGAPALPLERLSPQDSAALLEAEAGATLPGGALAWVYERARGNPLFTLEYFRLLARQGHLWNSGDHWRWRAPLGGSVPVTVEAVIEQGLNEAGNSAHTGVLISALAMLPDPVDDAQLAAVTALTPGQLAAAQAELRRRGVLSNGHFAHPLYREVERRMLGPAQRRLLAGRALDTLQRDPQAAAAFIDLAGLNGPPALDLLRRAADDAAQRGQAVRQAGWLEGALGHASAEESHSLAVQAARILVEHDLARAGVLAGLAARERPDDFQTVLLLAEIQARQRRLSEAEQLLDGLAGQSQLALSITAKRIELRSFARQYRAATDLWRQHRGALEAVASAFLHGQVAFCLIILDQEDEALELATAGLERFECSAEERAKFLGIQAMFYSRRGLPGQAVTVFEQVAQEYERIGSPRRTAAAYANLAIALGQVGHVRQQAAAWEQSVRHYEQCADPYNTGISRNALAGVLTRLGRYQEAEDLLLDFQDLLRNDDPATAISYCCILCELYAAWRTPVSGLLLRKYALQAVQMAREFGNPGHLADPLNQLIHVELAGGHFARADELSRELLTLAGDTDNPEVLVGALRARAAVLSALERPTEADEALRTGERLAAEHDLHDELHLAGLECAHLHQDLENARDHLDWFRDQGLRSAADRAVALFPVLDDPSVWTADEPLIAKETRLNVLGDMRFGPPGAGAAVRGRKRRELLACLLDSRLRGRPDVPRLTLTDALYPGNEEGQAASALKELIHQTRAALGPGVIQTTGGGYALGEVQSDAELFLQSGDTALWRGPYLAGEEPEQGGLMAETLYGALSARAQGLCAENPAEAARLGRLLCEASPYDPAALALTLRALRAAGNHRSLGRFYAFARQGFEEVGEQLPADWAAFLETPGAQVHGPA